MKEPVIEKCARMAREYLDKSGLEIPEARKVMKAYIGLRGTTIGENSADGHTAICIDEAMEKNCRMVLKGLNHITRLNNLNAFMKAAPGR